MKAPYVFCVFSSSHGAQRCCCCTSSCHTSHTGDGRDRRASARIRGENPRASSNPRRRCDRGSATAIFHHIACLFIQQFFALFLCLLWSRKSPTLLTRSLQVASVRGWNVVVKKGLYAPGDLVIYCEIDSILPPWQYFINGAERMHRCCSPYSLSLTDKLDKAKFRIRTIKLRNQLSQGYCIPVPALLQHPDKKVTVVFDDRCAFTLFACLGEHRYGSIESKTRR